MELKEVLESLGVDYEVLKERFSYNENLLRKFILKFPGDDCYHQLQLAIESEDYETIMRMAHTLKGLAANLGFDQLSFKCNDLVQYLRENGRDDVIKLNRAIGEEYNRIITGLALIDD